MPDPTRSDGTYFDEKELLSMGWPLWVVQYIKRSFEATADKLLKLIEINADGISENKQNIAKNTENITKNTDNIAENTENITKNTADIAKNKALKADKIRSPVLDNIVIQTADGNIKDGGFTIADLQTQTGIGTPEGSVISNLSLRYIDTTPGAEVAYFSTTVNSADHWFPT